MATSVSEVRRQIDVSNCTDVILLVGGHVVTPHEVLETADVLMADGRIVAIGESLSASDALKIDVRGKVVMPGMIDLHSDALEKFIEPRAKARFPFEVAVTEFDKYLTSCGITTMYHCICFMETQAWWSIRSLEAAIETVHAINALAPHLNVRNKIHARYDLPSVEQLPHVRDLVEKEAVHLLSLMDHTPGQGQYGDIEDFMKNFGKKRQKDLSEDEIRKFIQEKEEKQARIDYDALKALIDLGHEKGISVASHDDDTVEKVEWVHAHGIQISEFPVTMEALKAAEEKGMYTGFGAPNYLRGSSHSNNISARDALAEGLGDFMCSDYAPMSMLHAVFTLHNLDLGTLPDLVRLVSLNPAMAVGVDEELGSIEEGKLADVIVVDKTTDVVRLSRVFVGGKEMMAIRTE